jgi:hypothetical protein
VVVLKNRQKPIDYTMIIVYNELKIV